MAPSQRYVRGIFSGGTFCFEAQLVHRSHGITAHSNTPVAGNTVLADIRTSLQHTIIDMGDDEFTQGRPHPMIDPSGKDARIRDEIADPTTAVVLFDVVLGYGSADDPTAELMSIIDSPGPRLAPKDGPWRSSATCAAPTSIRRIAPRPSPACSPPGCWSPRAMPRPPCGRQP